MNKTKLLDYGFKYDEAVNRCVGNEALYESLLVHFSNNNDCINTIMSSYETKDYQTLKDAIHEVKGISGNLGIYPLFEITCALMDEYRVDNFSNVDLYNSFIEEYKHSISVIKEACK